MYDINNPDPEQNLGNEINLTWDDRFLDLLLIELLLGDSMEFIGTKLESLSQTSKHFL